MAERRRTPGRCRHKLPDPCDFLSGQALEEYFGVPVDAGYHPGFTGGLLTGEERSCSWDTTELFNEGSLTVALYTAKDHVTHSTYPAGRTTDVAIDGASDAYAVAKTPYRIYFIKNGVSAQALYMPDYEGGEPDDTAEMAKFTTFVTQQVAAKL